MKHLHFCLALAGYAACGCALVACSAATESSSVREGENAGVWRDASSGLLWQEPQFLDRKTWADAQAACDALVLAGSDEWRLPTLSELRSAARDCAATVTGGSCAVTDQCLETTCFSAPCEGCAELGGHAMGGCYRPTAFTGDCMTTWTSSVAPNLPEEVWTVGFGGCHVLTYPKSIALNTRCVRRDAN